MSNLKTIQNKYTESVRRLDVEYKEKRSVLDLLFEEQRTIMNKTLFEITPTEFEKAKSWIEEANSKSSVILRQELPNTKTTHQKRKNARFQRRNQTPAATTEKHTENPNKQSTAAKVREAINSFEPEEVFTSKDVSIKSNVPMSVMSKRIYQCARANGKTAPIIEEVDKLNKNRIKKYKRILS